MRNESQAVDLLEGGAQDVNLTEVASLCEQLLEKQSEFDSLEERSKLLKQEINHLEEVLIPEKMGSLAEVKLQNGRRILVESFVRANIKVEERPVAFRWLDENGQGEIIKTEVQVKYGRGEIDKAKETVAKLSDMGYANVTLHEEVHWQTLNAWAKARFNNGGEFPECIGIYSGKKAKVK